MTFNAYDFLFGFLPLVLLGHRLAWRYGRTAMLAWLVGASLLFYAWWYAPYLLLLVASLAVNYALGRRAGDADASEVARRRAMVAGIVFDLGLLGVFKYAGFFAENVAALTGQPAWLPEIALPLGISFFTFQQIAWLVDAHAGRARVDDPLEYALFVCFFPQLVAGPIVHHGEMMPQFAENRRPSRTDVAVGATIFVIGLAKKVIVADTLAPEVETIFGHVAAGGAPTVLGAWRGLLSYHFQLYYDFSGYSDMAIGLARLFGIRLPANFDAPYRANSIVEFWRRWHITLSRFLREYLYIPLGGNRHGEGRRYLNLFLTMLLGGLWHGAGWTYVFWGGLHGVYLMISTWWNDRWRGRKTSRLHGALGRAATWLGLLVGWAFFRAEDFGDALALLRAAVGVTPSGAGTMPGYLPVLFVVLTAHTQLFPTTQRWMAAWEPVLEPERGDPLTWGPRWQWAPTPAWGAFVGAMALACLPVLERTAQFLYWQF